MIKNINARLSGGLRALFRSGALRALPILCAVMMFALVPAAFAEGSADMHDTATAHHDAVAKAFTGTSTVGTSKDYTLETAKYGVMGSNPQQQRFKFYAQKGEYVFLGASGIGNATADAVIISPTGETENVKFTANKGKITNLVAAQKGPVQVHMPKLDGDRKPKTKSDGAVDYAEPASDGYTAYDWSVPSSGVYIVEFKTADTGLVDGVNKEISQWDITVAEKRDDDYYAISGRVWVDALVHRSLNDYYGTFFCTTRDGYIYKFGFNDLDGATFQLVSNSRGLIKRAENRSAYHSVSQPYWNSTSGFDTIKDKYDNDAGIIAQSPDNETTELDAPNHMFLNYPAKDLPSDILQPNAIDVGEITSLRFDGRSKTDEAAGNVSGYVGAGGYFEVETRNASSYHIIIDMSNMYAKDYHGQTDRKSGVCSTDDESHNDEICLGNKNFIFHSGDKWYEIKAKDSNPHGASEIVEIPQNEVSTVTNGYSEDGVDFGDYKCCGRVMLGNAVNGSTDSDRIYWNGRDEWGRSLPAGSYFGDNATSPGKVYAQAKAGEIHIPVADAEHMYQGVSILLMNPPAAIAGNGDAELSKIYFNDQEKSLLFEHEYKFRKDSPATYDFYGYNQWWFNLPHTSGKSTVFTPNDKTPDDGNSKYLKWYTNKTTEDFENEFINASIDGVSTYDDKGEDGQEKLANAEVNKSGYKSNGCDFAWVDYWTNIISPTKFALNGNITLENESNIKIISGFVFMDDQNGWTPNAYSTKDNDTALPGVTVKAYKGDVTAENIADNEPFYETTTNSDGMYSIPVNVSDETKVIGGKVTVMVQMEDDYMKNGVLTVDELNGMSLYKVVTINGSATGNANQKYGNLSSISIQQVDVEKDTPGKRIIEPEKVGYVNKPVKTAIRIQKTWYPEADYDSTLTSKFNVEGTIKTTKGETITVYKRDGIEPTQSTDQAINLTDLPGTTYYIPEDKQNGKAAWGDVQEAGEKITIDYKVTEVMDGKEVVIDESANTLTLASSDNAKEKCEEFMKNPDNASVQCVLAKQSDVPIEGDKKANLWMFCNRIEPSELVVKVWEDADRSSSYGDGDKMLGNAKVQIEKFTLSTTEDDFSKEVEDNVGYKWTESGGNETLAKGGTLITKTEDNDQDKKGELHIYGLKSGKYRITVTPPEDDYKLVTWNNDGALYKKVGGADVFSPDYATKSYTNGNAVSMIINIGGKSVNELQVGYAPKNSALGGLLIKKEVAWGDNATGDEKLLQSITDTILQEKEGRPKFKFEIMLSSPPQVEGADGDNPVTVTANTYIGGEYGTQKITFKQLTDSLYNGRWSTIGTDIKLGAEDTIYIPNVVPTTKYWIYEYDSKADINNPNGSAGYDGDANNFMPKGFSLQNTIGKGKMQSGQAPGVGDLSVTYTNVYNPDPATGYAGTKAGEVDANNGEYEFKIAPKVVLENKPKDFNGSFTLLLEPVGNAPAFENGEIDVSSAQLGESVSFENNVSATFDKPGEYSYTLRQALPFKDGGDAIPGVSYDPTEYTLTFEVVHEYAQLKINPDSVKLTKKGGAELDDSELVFTNKYKNDVTVSIQGTQVLESEIDGLLDGVFKNGFTYTIEDGGVKGTGVDNGTHGKMPATAETTNDGADINFGEITFDPNDAGESAAEPRIYKYTVKQKSQPDDVTDKEPNQYDIYIAVYKEIVKDDQYGDLKQIVSWGFCDGNGDLLTDGAGGFTFIDSYSTSIEKSLTDLGATLKAKLDHKGDKEPTLGDDAEFKFVLSGTDDASKATLPEEQERIEYTCKANGTISGAVAVDTNAPKLKFTKDGTYTYTLRQIDPNGEKTELTPIPGVTYDGGVDNITITVTAEASTGELNAKLQQKIQQETAPIAELDKEVVTFTNTYDPDNQSITIIGMKTVTSDVSAVSATDFADKFRFKIENAGDKKGEEEDFGTDKAGTLENNDNKDAKNDRDNGSAFAFTLNFTTADALDATEENPVIYRYKITEAAPGADVHGFKENKSEQYAYVKVYKAVINGAETVIATRCDKDGNTEYENDILFENKYTPETSDKFNLASQLNITKTVSKQTQDDKGLSGTFEFEIQRMSVVDGQTQGDGIDWTSSVTVKDFNTPVAVSGFTAEGAKHNRDLSSLDYDKPAEYQYVIFENKPEKDPISGMVYSGERYTVSVSVTDKDDAGNPTGKLMPKIIKVSKTDGASNYTDLDKGADGKYPISFTNQYFGSEPVAPMKLSGLVALDGTSTMEKEEFSFTLESAGSKPLNQLAVDWSTDMNPMPEGLTDGKKTVGNQSDDTDDINVAEGSVDFGQILFNETNAGKLYRYKVTQVDTGVDGVVYDEEVEKYVYIRVEQSTVDNVPTVHGQFCDVDGNAHDANIRPFRFDNKLRRGHLEYDVGTTGGEWADSMQGVLEENGNFNCKSLGHTHTGGDVVSLPGIDLSRWAIKEGCALVGWTLDPHPDTVTSKEEEETVLDKEAVVPGSGATVVYAVWGIDGNHNGKADYSEARFTHMYHANTTLGGTLQTGSYARITGDVPANKEDVLLGTDIEFASDTQLQMDVISADGTTTHYVQAGWSAVPHPAAKGADEAAQWQIQLNEDGTRHITNVMHLSAYAIWAEDSDSDGSPDYVGQGE